MGADVVAGHVGQVLGIVPVGEDPAVHERVQRHDPVAEHVGEAGEVGDVDDGHAGLGDALGRCRRSRPAPSPGRAAGGPRSTMPVLS